VGVETITDWWEAALIVHPTCELAKPSLTHVQVARVARLDHLPSDRVRAEVVAGIAERDGAVGVAWAHTFFVAPVPDTDLAEPMFADLRVIAPAPREQFTVERRVGAMTHDCRVTLLRRYLYFRMRWNLSFEQVRNLEALRISSDPAFEGPRPDWAPER
jgi:hypothetical protein